MKPFFTLIFLLMTTTIHSQTREKPSADFSFASQFITIDGAKMHYFEDGAGDPVLFLHGVPMHAYSWRNVIPHVSGNARCIALDFMGFGKSDHPEMDYSFDEQYRYLSAFIEALDLRNLTLVMTDIGGILGNAYAMNHPERIKGLVFMETPLSDAKTFHETGGMMQHMMFWMARKEKMGYRMFVKRNMFIKMMPMLIKRKLSKLEKATYKQPFPTRESRIPMFVLPHSFPKKGRNAQPGDMADYLNKNAEFLTQSNIPKLLLFAKPGMLVNKKVLAWAGENLPALTVQHVGKGKHLIEEDVPDAIGGAIHSWMQVRNEKADLNLVH